MKKFISLGIALVVAGATAIAQEFPVQWKSKFGFKADRWYYDEDGKYVLGRTDDEAEVLDGATGKSIWKLNFKNDLKVKSLSRATYNEAEGLVLFYNEDGKKANGEKIVVDLATGKELWRGDQYAGVDADGNFHFAHCISDITAKGNMMVFNAATKKFTGLNVRTGKVLWESKAYPDVDISEHIEIDPIGNSEYAKVFIFNDDVLKTQILFMSINTGEVLQDDSRFVSAHSTLDQSSSGYIHIRRTVGNTAINLEGKMKELGFKISFTLEATGDVKWKQEFQGSAVRQLWNDAPYVKMDIQGDMIFVMAKQITVFDLKSGKQLWTAPFDNCDASVGLKAKQEFGIAGWPLVSGNDVFYVDLRVDNTIKKVNGKTGQVIWQSEKLKSNDRIPNLLLVDGVLVAQFGGMINTQIYIANPNGGSTYKTENRFDGNYEVRAYDPATGKLLWKTADFTAKLGDKFKERISTIYPINNKVVVATSENVFCLEPKTGEMIYKLPLAPMKIGDMVEVLVADDYETAYVFCDNGVASVNGASGKVNYSTKTDEIFWKVPGSASYTFTQGRNTFIRVGAADFIAFDFGQGKVLGKMEDNSNPQFTADGNSIFVRDGASVTRYAVTK